MSSRLRYEDRYHRYALDGEYVPSVTGVTGLLDKPALAPTAAKITAWWAVHNTELIVEMGTEAWVKTAAGAYRDEWNAKRDRGTNLHKHAEQLIRTGYTDAPTGQLPLVYSAADFLDRWDVDLMHTEAAVYSAVHRYAGRLDLIGRLGDGKVWLLDFKTGSGVWPEHVLQAAGYRYATHLVDEDGNDVPMPTVDHAGIVHVRPGTEDRGDWDLHPVTADDRAFETFLGLLAAYPFTKRDKDAVVLAPLPHPEAVA